MGGEQEVACTEMKFDGSNNERHHLVAGRCSVRAVTSSRAARVVSCGAVDDTLQLLCALWSISFLRMTMIACG